MRIARFACIRRYLPWLILIAATPIPAFGQGFGPIRWDYVTANFAVPELDEIGLELDGSTAVTETLVVFGAYRNFEPQSRVDQETLQIGVGRRWNVRPNIDVMASLSYADNSVDVGGQDADEEGLILGGHIRGWITQRFELNGGVHLDNSVGSSTQTILEIGTQFFPNRTYSYGGRLRSDEDDSAVFLGARFYFGASRR